MQERFKSMSTKTWNEKIIGNFRCQGSTKHSLQVENNTNIHVSSSFSFDQHDFQNMKIFHSPVNAMAPFATKQANASAWLGSIIVLELLLLLLCLFRYKCVRWDLSLVPAEISYSCE
jgi:hypothetical protein